MKKTILLFLAILLIFSPAYAGMSQGQKMQVWRFYVNAEDLYGMDRAEAITAKKFGISKKQVVDIKVEGNMNLWPLPEEEGLPPEKPKSEAQRQKEIQDFATKGIEWADQVKKH